MNQQSKQPHKLGVLATITGVIALITIALTAMETFVVYPTEAHRDTSQQMRMLQTEATSSGSPGTVLESATYKELSSSPEAQYSLTAAAITVAVLFIVRIGMIGFVYNYIRSRRLVKHDTWATALVMMAAWLVSLPVVTFIGAQLLGYSQSPLELLYSVLLGITLGTLIDYLFARVFKWRYNRKHSFVVD
ncbi:MAG TPA: hypothetical protein VD907_00960 [Verrucomicrobiae bacterium]|nr:hypothetical protein [Verrucomicrobiae bacterium]